MHYLVTGGAGFIGSHLTDDLLASGHRVTVIDDCSTGDMANLAGAMTRPECTILHGSVCDEILVDEAVAEGVDAIVHLAAAVGVKHILAHQVRSIVTNLRGTEVVLRAAVTHGRIPVFLASTSEVYGKSTKAPYVETDDSVLGATSIHRWSYACTKAMDEFLALAHHRERGLPVIIARFFNVTGPRQSSAYGMVLPTFCTRALAGQPLQVHGTGTQMRTFLHVTDCVNAIRALLDCPGAVGEVINIGGDQEISMAALAEAVKAVTGADVPIEVIPYEQAYPEGGFEDMLRRVPDTGKLLRLTGWKPTRPLAGIIDDCLATIAKRRTP